MKKSKKKQRIVYVIGVVVFLIFTLGPFVWAFFVSITPEFEMFKNTTSMLPKQITWDNYRRILESGTRQHEVVFQGLANSLTAVGLTMVIGLPIALAAAYALSRMKFKGRRLIRDLILITMVIPVLATIIPLFRIFMEHDMLDNSFWLSMVYVSSFLPMSIWLMSNYFSTIPGELEEAAWVDGCGRIHAFFKIILPISYPILFSAALIMFLSAWNQFQIPLILASSFETKPISIVTSEFMSKDSVQYGITAAAGLIAVLPPTVAALVFRKFLVSGMTNGATKG
nr:carbohydrate ABC transporter permease [uncultured Sellimonas sp.]